MGNKFLKYTLAIMLSCPLLTFGQNKPNLTHTIQRSRDWSSGQSFSYAEFKAENLPVNIPLEGRAEKIDKSIEANLKLKIDEEGRLINMLDGKEWALGFGTFLKGEPIKFILSKNGTDLASTIIVPRPIAAKDDAGHTLSLMLASRHGDVFQLEATGFKPFEEVQACSISGDEKVESSIKASEEGKITAIIQPVVKGQVGGKASFEIQYENTKKLKVNYWWGFAIFELEDPYEYGVRKTKNALFLDKPLPSLN